MATPNPFDTPDSMLSIALVRDVVAVMLLLVGIVGLAAAAFFLDWRLGIAVVSVESIVAGVILGYRR